MSIRILGLRDDAAYVIGDAGELPRGSVVRLGTTTHPLSPVGDRLDLLRGVNRLTAAADPAAWTLDRPEAVLGLNDNPAWTVDRLGNPLLLAWDGEGAVTATYAGPGEFEVRPHQDYEFLARVGTVGAQVDVVVELLAEDGRVVFRRDRTAPPPSRGGTKADDYGTVRLRLTATRSAARARVSLVLRPDTPGTTGFGFVHSVTFSQAGTPIHELTADDTAVLQSPDVAIHRAHLVATTGNEPTSLDVVGPGGKVLASQPLPDLTGAQVRTRGLVGNSFKIAVDNYAGVLNLYVDNEPVGSRRARKVQGRQRFRFDIPERFWDGELHLADVRDASSTRIMAQTAMLLPLARYSWPRIMDSPPPRPYQLSPQAGLRYRALNDALEKAAHRGAAAEEYAQLTRAHAALVAGPGWVTDYTPLRFPHVADPEVSVIVPVHDKFEATYHCLAALALSGDAASFEVVVVDDGSSDETLRLADLAPGVTVVRHEQAQGFNGAVTAGAAAARGRYLALLNNDTEPTSGWLDELLDAFTRFDRVGLVGSRLIYPDGRLQEAGGIVWATGDPMNYGNRRGPWNPRYSYARQVDYVSGAALLIPREVWDAVGGLSPELAPAYFEDTDLAFKVREAGLTTWYVPSSIVYHMEGASNGTDVEEPTGLKRFQEINRPKFKEKWAAAYASNGDPELDDPDLVKDRNIRGRVLFLDMHTPRPDHDAGSYAARTEIKLVQSLGYKVTFMANALTHVGRYTEELERDGVEVVTFPYSSSLEQILEWRGQEFDAVFITRYQVAQEAIPLLKKYAPQAKVLFNNADLHFLRLAREATVASDEADWNSVAAVRDVELAAMREVDVVLSYNEVEHAVIASHNLGSRATIATCPWVVPARDAGQVPPFTGREGIAFLGGYRHPPNVDAAMFFVSEVMPGLVERVPGVKLYLYGSAMPDSLRDLASDHVVPVGFVESTQQMHDRHRVFVAPLRVGAGIKGKVLSAMADGIPTVLSPVAAEGIGIREEYDALLARSPEQWADAVARLYTDEAAWSGVSASGLDLMTRKYSFATGRELMAEAFAAAGLR